jgi:capsular polysaccharide biosynthesis protein
MGIGHWVIGHSHRTQTATAWHGTWGFWEGEGASRESLSGKQGCSCVESGGTTRKCHVSAAHTGGCCILLRGYPTPPVLPLPFHGYPTHCQPAHTEIHSMCLYTRIVRCVASVEAKGTRYKHAPSTHPAGRNGLKELPGWDLARQETALSRLTKWTPLDGARPRA